MKMLRRTTVIGSLVAVLAACGGASTVTISVEAHDAYRLAEATVQRAYAKSDAPGVEELNAAFENERENTSLPENWKIATVSESQLEVQLWVPGEAGAETASHGRQAETLLVESDDAGTTTTPKAEADASTTTVVLGSETTTDSHSTDSHSGDSKSTNSHSTDSHSSGDAEAEATSDTTAEGTEDATTVAPSTTVAMRVALAACIVKEAGIWESSSEPCEHSDESHGDAHAAGPAHWSYEGETGPSHWGDLDPSYTMCVDGSSQTPVDVKDTVKADLPDPVISYGAGKALIENNGHTIQANASAGNVLTLDGVEYPFMQIHFHAPSEHTIEGKHFDAEVHFVHKRADGKLAVIGVMIEKSEAENKAWKPYTDSLAILEGSTVEVDIDWNGMLPAKRDTYRYQGSLTTPPCSEGVTWVLMQNPVKLSAAQIKDFQNAYDHNNRPLQEIGSRVIEADKAS
jgi:carbonic anhydrase